MAKIEAPGGTMRWAKKGKYPCQYCWQCDHCPGPCEAYEIYLAAESRAKEKA